MLREIPTQAMRNQWEKTFAQYKDRLRPNRKSGQQVVDYLLSRYPLEPLEDERARQVVADNVLNNACFREKLPAGEQPRPKTFRWRREGREVFIGVDLASGLYHIEEDPALWDELCAFQGLDAYDLQNCYCVHQYITCLQRYGALEAALHSCE